MKSCVYPGSFDPVTCGHMDIIGRASALFDKVYVAVLHNTVKKYYYDGDKRFLMARKAALGFDNVEVVSSGGLLTDLMRKLGTSVILRGLRSGDDLELERQLFTVNEKLLPGTETVMLMSHPEVQYISSTIVRELIQHSASLEGYVPSEILDMI